MDQDGCCQDMCSSYCSPGQLLPFLGHAALELSLISWLWRPLAISICHCFPFSTFNIYFPSKAWKKLQDRKEIENYWHKLCHSSNYKKWSLSLSGTMSPRFKWGLFYQHSALGGCRCFAIEEVENSGAFCSLWETDEKQLYTITRT